MLENYRNLTRVGSLLLSLPWWSKEVSKLILEGGKKSPRANAKKDLGLLKSNGPGHRWVGREATWVQKMA